MFLHLTGTQAATPLREYQATTSEGRSKAASPTQEAEDGVTEGTSMPLGADATSAAAKVALLTTLPAAVGEVTEAEAAVTSERPVETPAVTEAEEIRTSRVIDIPLTSAAPAEEPAATQVCACACCYHRDDALRLGR